MICHKEKVDVPQGIHSVCWNDFPPLVLFILRHGFNSRVTNKQEFEKKKWISVFFYIYIYICEYFIKLICFDIVCFSCFDRELSIPASAHQFGISVQNISINTHWLLPCKFLSSFTKVKPFEFWFFFFKLCFFILCFPCASKINVKLFMKFLSFIITPFHLLPCVKLRSQT